MRSPDDREKLLRIAKALGFTAGRRGFWIEQERVAPYRWWLCGGIEGDQPLPRTAGVKRSSQALAAAWDWMAPEVEKTQ